jgi:hypothetical protein
MHPLLDMSLGAIFKREIPSLPNLAWGEAKMTRVKALP